MTRAPRARGASPNATTSDRRALPEPSSAPEQDAPDRVPEFEGPRAAPGAPAERRAVE